jgi:hypothetical protein
VQAVIFCAHSNRCPDFLGFYGVSSALQVEHARERRADTLSRTFPHASASKGVCLGSLIVCTVQAVFERTRACMLSGKASILPFSPQAADDLNRHPAVAARPSLKGVPTQRSALGVGVVCSRRLLFRVARLTTLWRVPAAI